MKVFSWRFIRMWQRNRDVFLRLWHAEVPSYVAEPVIVILTMGIGLSTYVGVVNGQGYLDFIVPGIVASYAMYSVIFDCTYGTYSRLEYQKTYDAILATPLSVEDIIAGEICWGATRSVMTSSAILTVAALFGLVHSPWAALIPPLCFIEGVLFGSIAEIFTSFVPSMYTFNYFYTLFVTPMFYFSGVFFPLTSFSETVQHLSWLAPLTPVVYIARNLTAGRLEIGMLWALLAVIAMTAFFLLIALARMRKRVIV